MFDSRILARGSLVIVHLSGTVVLTSVDFYIWVHCCPGFFQYMAAISLWIHVASDTVYNLLIYTLSMFYPVRLQDGVQRQCPLDYNPLEIAYPVRLDGIFHYILIS